MRFAGDIERDLVTGFAGDAEWRAEPSSSVDGVLWARTFAEVALSFAKNEPWGLDSPVLPRDKLSSRVMDSGVSARIDFCFAGEEA